MPSKRTMSLAVCAAAIGFAYCVCSPSARARPAGATDALAIELSALKDQEATLQEKDEQILEQISQLEGILTAQHGTVPPPGSVLPDIADLPPDGPPELKKAQDAINPPPSLSITGLPAEGSDKATVGMIEFIDYQDPDTAKYDTDVFHQLEDAYIKTGKVRYFHRDMNLPWNNMSIMASTVGRCSDAVGLFWPMRERLLTNQKTYDISSDVDRATFIGMNPQAIQDCFFPTNKYSSDIVMSVIEAQSFGIVLSPTIFIGRLDAAGGIVQIDKTILGAQPLSVYQAALDAELNPPKANASTMQEDMAAVKKHIASLRAQQGDMGRMLQDVLNIAQGKQAAPTPVPPPPAPHPASLPLKGLQQEGPGTAKVALLEFTDFECSYCGQYAREVYPQIYRDYVQTGKIQYFYHSMPLPFHPHSRPAAEAAMCAALQGKFWEMHDSLFADQSHEETADFTSRAQAFGLNMDQFNSCIAADKDDAFFKRDEEYSEKVIGINGTPCFFIGIVQPDGTLKVDFTIAGSDPYADYKNDLDTELAKPSA